MFSFYRLVEALQKFDALKKVVGKELAARNKYKQDFQKAKKEVRVDTYRPDNKGVLPNPTIRKGIFVNKYTENIEPVEEVNLKLKEKEVKPEKKPVPVKVTTPSWSDILKRTSNR